MRAIARALPQHAALRGALRAKPSLANDHDISQVWARLNKHGQTASARTFLKWVGLATSREESGGREKGVEDDDYDR